MTEVLSIKVLADHREDGTPFYELLQMKPEADGFRLIYSPAFVQGIAAGDLVAVDEDGYATALERGGNLCIQVMALNPTPEFASALSDAMNRVGAFQDGLGPAFSFLPPRSPLGSRCSKQSSRVLCLRSKMWNGFGATSTTRKMGARH